MNANRQQQDSNISQIDSDSEFQDRGYPGLSTQPSMPKRQSALRQRGQGKNYAHFDNDDIQEEFEEEDEQQFYTTYYKGGKITRVFESRIRQGTEEQERLCKLSSKSYLHLEWLTKKEIEARDIQDTKFNQMHAKKQKQNIEYNQEKYGKKWLFNPAFIRVDRVLNTAVLFPSMHHKKASEISGKWSESLMIVASKALNFEQFNIAYGILQKDDYISQKLGKLQLKNPITLQNIINRVYLDYYNSSSKFWRDVGVSIRNLEKIYEETPESFKVQILKQCLIFLYWQWHNLTKERYYKVAQEMKTTQKMDTKYETREIQSKDISFSVENQDPINWQIFTEHNIFLNEKKAELPTNQEGLNNLNPGNFSYSWLQRTSGQYNSYTFKHLKQKDLNNLDLKKQIDHLFLIKWCELDYDEVTWEKESELKNYSDKIKNFKLYSKVPPKKIRDKIEENKKYHHTILEAMFVRNPSQELSDRIQKCRRNLYLLTSKKNFKQYGGEDIPIYKDYKMLKQFQLQGLNWLIKGWHEKRNCILGDEMGLGKTIQTIAFLNHLSVFQGIIGPFLIVSPVSTLKQWRVEIEHWSDLNCVLYKGKQSCRQLIEKYEFYHKFVTNEGKLVKSEKIFRFQVFLTNYQLFSNDLDSIKQFPFQYIILDEAHRVKNQNTIIAKAIRQLPCPRILLLTGTPIQNNTSQLWGLLNIIEPIRFPSFEEFKVKYGNIKTLEELAALKETLKPFLLRRVKSDVEKTIPKLSETLVTLELTKIQKAYYKSIIEKNKNQLIHSLSNISLNNMSLCLRQCCNHPYMLSHEIAEDIEQNSLDDQDRVKKFVECSSKMIFIHKFLTRCIQNKQKTLIFSQFRDMVQLLVKYCQTHDVSYQWLDGNVGYEVRQTKIDRFNRDPDVSVFIISTKAGGVGINLTSATNIIIYDSDWNPQNDIQAIARAHRIGQRKEVSVFRLITNKTYEQIIYQTSVKKLGIGLAILDDQFFTNKQSIEGEVKKKRRSNQQVEKLLRDGVAGFLKNENQEEGNLQNITIEQIIKNSGKKIGYETKECAYTSAKFEYEGEGQKGLNIDDPNFWQVALKDVESPLQKLVKKLKQESPIRQQIFNDIKLQAELMIEASSIVYEFIKSKLQMKNFNAQDERQLKGFLEEITDSRRFHRGLKDIANKWIEQIEKTPRGFRKMKSEEILAKLSVKQSEKRVSREQPRKIVQKKSSRKKKSIFKVTSSDDEEGDEDHNHNEESLDQSDDPAKEAFESSGQEEELQKNKNPRKKVKTQTIEKKEKQLPEQSQEYEQLLENLCNYCFRKQCSKICDGMCNRMYHQACYKKYLNGQKFTESYELEEEKMPKMLLNKALAKEFYCEQCKRGESICFICEKSAQAIIFPPKIKTYKRSKISEKDWRQDQNYIDKVLQNICEQDKKIVFQCRLGTCNRFFHIECLNKLKNKLHFEIDPVKQENYYFLKCPRHFCNACKKSSATIRVSCVKCSVGYHTKCKTTAEKDFITLSNEFIMCREHLGQNQSLIQEIRQKEDSNSEEQEEEVLKIEAKVKTETKKQRMGKKIVSKTTKKDKAQVSENRKEEASP